MSDIAKKRPRGRPVTSSGFHIIADRIHELDTMAIARILAPLVVSRDNSLERLDFKGEKSVNGHDESVRKEIRYG